MTRSRYCDCGLRLLKLYSPIRSSPSLTTSLQPGLFLAVNQNPLSLCKSTTLSNHSNLHCPTLLFPSGLHSQPFLVLHFPLLFIRALVILVSSPLGAPQTRLVLLHRFMTCCKQDRKPYRQSTDLSILARLPHY